MKKNIYDNSNIAESYSGVTTPLTFSFVRYVYQEAYQNFCKMMGVNNKTIINKKEIYAHMVEFIGYRIYYNLNSWYKMISLFPGYKFSSRFMEKMMGVEKNAILNNNISKKSFKKILVFFPQTVLRTIFILISFLLIGKRLINFNKYFDNILNTFNSINLKKLSLIELQGTYYELEKKLLSRWKIPIVNDFAVMVSTGLADKLLKKWSPEANAYSFMVSSGGKALSTLDPGEKIAKICQSIKDDQNIHHIFKIYSSSKILFLIKNKYSKHPSTILVNEYLNKYSTNIPNGLKLESKTIEENNEIFINLLKNIISEKTKLNSKQKKLNIPIDNKIKKIFFLWLIKWSEKSIKRREESRFRRTLIFGYIRKLFIAMGCILEKNNIINNKNDIFFLDTEEIFYFIRNNKFIFNQKEIIEERKKQFNLWQEKDLPRRIETCDTIAFVEVKYLNTQKKLIEKNLNKIKGTVAHAPRELNICSGTTLTLKDFDYNAKFNDKILVTCQTDPGWTIIFPLLKAIIVERGGMLSHAAIVARETNIPCIIGVQNATDLITNNKNISINLKTGEILI